MLHHSKKIFFLGKRLHLKELHALHIGVVFSIYNLLLIDIFSIIAFVAPENTAAWLYIIVSAPFVFTLFWIWATQVILHEYKKVAWHEAFIIAKYSVWPFVALMILSGGMFVLSAGLDQAPGHWMVISYYTLLSSMFLIVLDFAIVSFFLRHPLIHLKPKT